MTHRLITVLCLCAATGLAAEKPPGTPAFPGAQGAGMDTVGGRFGEVYRVTNLNADGPGSLADAVSRPNRIVVFEVSGIIDLKNPKKAKGGRIDIDQPNITIAGQTAPGEGICIKGGALNISANQVIVRYIRSRRGFIADQDSGDSFEAKSPTMEAGAEAALSAEQVAKMTDEERKKYLKRLDKKIGRDKTVHRFDPRDHIILDHLSASWATDENLTMSHPNFTTAGYCIAAEGLDYANAKQTPPNHSEGSLWGVGVADGRSTMHHMLYAHNRLRNPRTTGIPSPEEIPPVLTFANGVIYDCSEYHSHTGNERVRLNWLNSFYKPGPSTSEELRHEFFRIMETGNKIYASGNILEGYPQMTSDNWLGIHGSGKRISAAEMASVRVDKPFETGFGLRVESAMEGYETVLRESGCTIPSRDPVDLRIVNSVRTGTGRVIDTESDLPPEERWPTYHSLPANVDSDGDGMPDYWEKQFGGDLKPMEIAAGGYANIEHYINSSDPTAGSGGGKPIVYVAASVSRARAGKQDGQWRVFRGGASDSPLTVRYTLAGAAGEVTIPAGATWAAIDFKPTASTAAGIVVIELKTGESGYFVGCPNRSLIEVQK